MVIIIDNQAELSNKFYPTKEYVTLFNPYIHGVIRGQVLIKAADIDPRYLQYQPKYLRLFIEKTDKDTKEKVMEAIGIVRVRKDKVNRTPYINYGIYKMPFTFEEAV